MFHLVIWARSSILGLELRFKSRGGFTVANTRGVLAWLPQPARESGQRRYAPDAVERILVLRKFQQAGLTLSELKAFQDDRPERQAVLRAKLAEIEERLVDLDQARQLLRHALQCSKPDIVTCPTFRAQSAAWLDSLR